MTTSDLFPADNYFVDSETAVRESESRIAEARIAQLVRTKFHFFTLFLCEHRSYTKLKIVAVVGRKNIFSVRKNGGQLMSQILTTALL